MTRLHELTPDNFDDFMARTPGLILIDFWAPWCAPCQVLTRILEEFAVEYDGLATFARLSVDDDPRRAVAMGVRGVPTIIFIRDGAEVDRLVGIEPPATLRARIDRQSGAGRDVDDRATGSRKAPGES